MAIPVEEVQALKARLDLVSVVQQHGITLKRKGKDYVGLCPFHQERTPSFTVNPRKQLYHCFGCPPDGKQGGDVIRFVSRVKSLGFRETLETLGADLPPRQGPPPGRFGSSIDRKERSAPKSTASAAAIKEETDPAPANAAGDDDAPARCPQKLLERVASFYEGTFADEPAGRQYLHARGLSDPAALKIFRAGFAAPGKLLKALPDEGDLIDQLKAIGVLTARGRELFADCVVFPLIDPQTGGVQSLYGRKIHDRGKVQHLYLPGTRRGLINAGAAQRSKTIVLTESVLDALTLMSNGFKNAVPCYGTNGFTDTHAEMLERGVVTEVLICFDADETGRTAAAQLRERLSKQSVEAHVVHLPDGEDLNHFFLQHSPDEFAELVHAARPDPSTSSPATTPAVRKRGELAYAPTEHGFEVQYGPRRYEVKGITRTATQLKVTLRAEPVIEDGSVRPDRVPFELTSLDLYSSRRRDSQAKVLARLFGEREPLVREDLLALIDRVERFEQAQATAPAPDSASDLSPDERAAGLALLTRSNLEQQIVADLDAMGLCGEETNKLLGYLVATSRKLPEPLSLVIQSRSGAGKSALQDAVLKLVPDEELCKYTRITDQALFYQQQNSLKHKVLAIEEAEGMGGAVYSLRALQSAGEVRILSTTKNPTTGQLESKEAVVEGPVAVMMTTTRPSTEVDGELASRNLFTTVDESKERTEDILKAQREKWTLDGRRQGLQRQRILERHHAAQRLLEPLEVVNRYAGSLRFPADSLRARRDQAKYLGLVAVIALLKQMQRPLWRTPLEGDSVMRFVEVERGDIALANELANQVLGHSLEELSPPSRKLALQIREMVQERSVALGVEPEQWAFSRRQIRESTGWSDFQVKTHVAELVELEYLVVRQGRKGREYQYELPAASLEGDRFLLSLTPIDELEEPPPMPVECEQERGPLTPTSALTGEPAP